MGKFMRHVLPNMNYKLAFIVEMGYYRETEKQKEVFWTFPLPESFC